MYSGVEEHVIYQIANAPLREYPYPHIYVESVFPQDYYAALRRNWPNSSSLVSLGATGRVPKGTYPERFIMALERSEVAKLPEALRGFWSEMARWLLAGRFFEAVTRKFEPYIQHRLGRDLARMRFSPESLVVRDHTNYQLGPHTDSPHHLLSLLFYCPDDESKRRLGTTIYTPRDPAFRCPGGPHYAHELFNKVATMEYRPNTLFAFVKTDNSFHGVEPIGEAEVLRDLLLYDICIEEAAAPEAAPRAAGTPSIGRKMLKHIFGAKG